jgi:hypothetical protein
MVTRQVQGPTRPGTNVAHFRKTGQSRSGGGGSGGVQGPVRPTTDEFIFRTTGRSVASGSSQAIKIREQIKATAKAQAIKKARQENLRKQAEATALKNKQLVAEQNRINRLRSTLIQQGAQRQTQILTDRDSRDRIKQETLINRRTGERIFIRTNLRTGLKTTRTFQRGKGDGLIRETGGIITTQTLKQLSQNPQVQAQVVKADPINVFSIKTWVDFANALNTSKFAGDRSLGKKILTEPLIFASKFIIRASELKDVPAGLWMLIKNPSNIKQIPNNIKVDLQDTLHLLKTNPSEGVGKIAGDYFTFKIISGTLGFTGQVTSRVATRLNPYFKSFKSNVITINAPTEIFVRKGSSVFLKKRITSTTILNRIKGRVKPFIKSQRLRRLIKVRKKGQFAKFQKGRGITLTKGTIGEGVPLSKQTKFAGTRGTITTAQADRLIGFFRRNKLIRKPIPNEANFSPQLKRLLKKFDNGTITRREFAKLNQLVLKESGKTLLERSLFADPTGKVRFTRLGSGVKEASLRDILRGNFTLKKTKPQIIVFPEGQIAKFPKSLRGIVKKLKAGKKLTPQERTKLVKWQTQKSGKWKPIGDIEYKGGVELEVTLAPSETIRRVKKLAVTEIDGVRVQIIQAKIVKLKPKTRLLLNKAKRGTITLPELKILKKLLSRETNLPIRMGDLKKLSRKLKVRRRVTGKPRLPASRLSSAKALQRLATKRKTKLRKGSRRTPPRRKTTPRKPNKRTPPTRRKPTKRGSVGRTTIKRKPTKRGRIRLRIPRTKTTRPTKKPPIKPRPKKFKNRTNKRSQPVYYVKEKIRGKVKNLTPRPLTLNDARDFLAYRLDNRLSRSGWFEPIGKSRKVVTPPKSIQGYFSRNSRKLRPYKIRVGKKKAIRNGYIEKRKYNLDKVGEVKALQRLRKKKTTIQSRKRRPTTIKTKKRKITPQRRRQLILQLKKARKMRGRK